jgi:hypothetical protein
LLTTGNRNKIHKQKTPSPDDRVAEIMAMEVGVGGGGNGATVVAGDEAGRARRVTMEERQLFREDRALLREDRRVFEKSILVFQKKEMLLEEKERLFVKEKQESL